MKKLKVAERELAALPACGRAPLFVAALAASAGAARGREVASRTLLTPEVISITARSGQLVPRPALSRSPAPSVQCRVMSGRAWVSCAASAAWVLSAALAAASLLPLDAEQLHASVGGFAVMNCHLDFPFGNEIPYHLQWDKDVRSYT